MHESRGSLSSSPSSIAHSSTAKAAPTASPIFLDRFPHFATQYDHSVLTNFNPVGSTSPNHVEDNGVYLLRADGLRALSAPIPGVGLGGPVRRTERTALGGLVRLAESTVLGGLVPRTEHAALGGLPLTSTVFNDFRSHEPRIRINGISAPPGRFVACVPASVATIKGCTGRVSISPAGDTVFFLFLPYPS